MRSGNSFFSFSGASMKEDLRRFRILPLITILAYFGFAILPVLLNYTSWENISDYTETVLTNRNIIISMIQIASGIGLSCAVFGYLHDTASCVAKHSKPITRSGLFWSSFTSGMIMIAIPIIITGIALFAVSGASASPDWLASQSMYDFDTAAKASLDVLTAPNILIWMLHSLLLSFYAFAFANLAGILAGLDIIHLLLAGFLLGAPSLIDAVINLLKSVFLYGYAEDFDFTMKLSPYLYLHDSEKLTAGDIPAMLIYLAVGILVTLLTVFIYRRIKLERERSSLVVPLVADILVIALTFVSATLLALLILELGYGNTNGKETAFLILVIVISLIFFPLFRMIADKSTRIFHPRAFVNLVIYAAIAALAFAFTVFDISGFENRVPDASDVASVEITSGYSLNGSITVTSPESAALACELHQRIVDNKDAVVPDGEEQLFNFGVRYTTKSGEVIDRNYLSVPLQAEKEYAALYESKEFRENDIIDTALIDRALDTLVVQYYEWYNSGTEDEEIWNTYDATDVKKEDIKALTEAINADLKARNFKDAKDRDSLYGTIEYNNEYYTVPDPACTEDVFFNIAVHPGDSNTKAFIDAHPYMRDWTMSGGMGPA